MITAVFSSQAPNPLSVAFFRSRAISFYLFRLRREHVDASRAGLQSVAIGVGRSRGRFQPGRDNNRRLNGGTFGKRNSATRLAR